ncbi:MAG: DNA polymerase III subunit delta' [Desulfobacterales bacterium]|nr:DNA polymerase III subunit delta' [Desulfobacterales bacterium]
MMTFESIIGQEKPIGLLSRMIEKDRIPHALLFTGIDGIGRQTTAKTLAMALNCLRPEGVLACGECRSCRKVISGNHPDIIIVKPSGAFIKIDQVRDVRRQLRFAPLEGNCRAIIVNDAHNMKTEAANAMLKILEEPPDATIIILTATQTMDLLPTIVSRCHHIPFRPIPFEKITGVLVARGRLDREAAGTVAILAKGSLGKALAADVKKWMAWRTGLLEGIGSISTESIQPLFAFADALARDKDRLEDALAMITVWFRDVLMCKVYPEKVVNRDFMDDIERASKKRSIDQILEKITAVFSAQTAIWRNSNPRLTLEVMMMRLYEQSELKCLK